MAATFHRERSAFAKEPKDHGGGGRIAGTLDPGDRVVITEDTVTRGSSLLEAARIVREEGAEQPAFSAAFSAPELGFSCESGA